LSKKTIPEPDKHAELLIPSIEDVLKQNSIWYQDLGLIVAINGPGSFTAIRVALACVKTIKSSTSTPVILLNSLEIIAYKYRNNFLYDKVFVANSSSVNEFFIGEFLIENQSVVSLSGPQLIRSDEVANYFSKHVDERILIVGNAKNAVSDLIKKEKIIHAKSAEKDVVDADFIGSIGYEKFILQEVIPDDLTAFYIKEPMVSARKW
jgi:tRNA threonylcarbamoyladenosine biosynthesis protein TsaB